jgi:hypothetical protein
MARFVVDIDSNEFNALSDKAATLVDVLEQAGYKIVTVFGIMEDNRCQFDEPSFNVERIINTFRMTHDCVLAPPESATVPKKFAKKGEEPEGAKVTKETKKPTAAAAKRRIRAATKKKATIKDVEDAEVVEIGTEA